MNADKALTTNLIESTVEGSQILFSTIFAICAHSSLG
jgi:hypothetical protein